MKSAATGAANVYDDLMAGLDYLEKLPYIDKERMAAAGGSFGGYMMNWFAVNTGHFKTLITHCGVWNFDSMYATTDELWFDEWEHGGPPWGAKREAYEKHSPHRLAANLAKFKTPMLIIHNDLDFRVPISAGPRVVHDPATAGRAVAVCQLPRRRPLGAEAGEQRLLAQGGVCLAEEIRQSRWRVTTPSPLGDLLLPSPGTPGEGSGVRARG